VTSAGASGGAGSSQVPRSVRKLEAMPAHGHRLHESGDPIAADITLGGQRRVSLGSGRTESAYANGSA
jgi:hypothetical protein